ncbi:MAG: amidohydrolase family protein [Actinomycetota bacterium]
MRTLYRASRVHTLSHAETGEWILVDGRHVERVGAGDPPTADRIVDLPGATILPGFVDSHVHLTGTGMSVATPAVAEARSAAELLRAVSEIGVAKSGARLAHGFDETKWELQGLPGIEDLDEAAGEPLILVRVDGHAVLANSAALASSGALEMEGVRHDSSGRPSGLATREAAARLQAWFAEELDDGEIEGYQLQAASLGASRGVTSGHEMSVPMIRGIRDLEVLLRHRDRLPMDVITYVASTDIPLVMDMQVPAIGGDLFLDGSIGAHTAALSGPYADLDSEGVLYFEDDELCEFLHNAHLAGLQVGVHAIGDRAIDQAVRCWGRVYSALDSRQRRHFRARRHRIEHCEMPNEDHLEQLAILGLAVSVQPAFDAEWGSPGRLYELRLGEDRAFAMNPFRSMLDRGLEVGGGSDTPITNFDPAAGIRALEQHHNPIQSLSREEAIRLFTRGGARLAHLEDKKGHLGPGTHADFAAYENDPLTEADMSSLRPLLTVSLGREVHAV